jgi:gluconate kinase
MVIFVMGTDRSQRSSVGRMLAITLDWEFADADELPPTYVDDRPDNMQGAKSTRLRILSAALQYWVYNWRDVIVSCWELTEQDRKLLGTNLPLVKFIYLRSAEDSLKDDSSQAETIASISIPNQTETKDRVLIIDPSRKAKQIIAEIVGILVLNRRAQGAVAS